MNILVFKELLDKNLASVQCLNKLFFSLNTSSEFASLVQHTDILSQLLENDVVTFRDVVDKFKSSRSLEMLISEKTTTKLRVFELLDISDYKYLLKKLSTRTQLIELAENENFFSLLCKRELFTEILNRFCKVKSWHTLTCLGDLLNKDKLLERLLDSQLISNNDVRQMLGKIENTNELHMFCENVELVKHSLKHFILDTFLIDKFNDLFKNVSSRGISSLLVISEKTKRPEKLQQLHHLIVYHNKYDDELQELLKVNEQFYEFLDSKQLNTENKQILYEVIQNSNRARETLMQILHNNLLSAYTFDQLKDLLMKTSEKKIKFKLNL